MKVGSGELMGVPPMSRVTVTPSIVMVVVTVGIGITRVVAVFTAVPVVVTVEPET